MAQKPIFIAPEIDPFSQVLNTRVNAYFAQKNISRHFDTYMVLKTIFFLGSMVALYLTLLLVPMDTAVRLGVAGLLGFCVAQIGFNVGHDAIHRAYSSRPWVNTLLGHSFSLMGANVFVWRTLHNVIHHSYTNIHGADGDLHPVGLLRFSQDAPYKPIHKYQYIYAPFLYALISLVWVFKKDFDYFKKPNHLIYKKPPKSKAVMTELYVAKSLYYFFAIALPLAVAPASWPVIMTSFLVMHFVTGLTLTSVFQLGHIVEGPAFLTLKKDGAMNESWSAHQVRTTANFAIKSPLALWFTGGLNFQIEHHLFPRICHTHYPALSKIVRRTALEFGLPYTEFPTHFAAVKSHMRLLKKLGRDEKSKQGDIVDTESLDLANLETFTEVETNSEVRV